MILTTKCNEYDMISTEIGRFECETWHVIRYIVCGLVANAFRITPYLQYAVQALLTRVCPSAPDPALARRNRVANNGAGSRV